jgi:hypothetical protein
MPVFLQCPAVTLSAYSSSIRGVENLMIGRNCGHSNDCFHREEGFRYTAHESAFSLWTVRNECGRSSLREA